MIRTALPLALAALFLSGGCGPVGGNGPAETPAADPAANAPAPPSSADGTPAARPEGSAPVTVDNAFILEPAAGRDIASGGVTLMAEGGDLRLVGGASPLAERVELHTMVREDGMMAMRQVEAIDLPAGIPVTLKGGGDHLMLFGIGTLDPEEPFPLTLSVQDSDGKTYDIEVEASIRPLGQ